MLGINDRSSLAWLRMWRHASQSQSCWCSLNYRIYSFKVGDEVLLVAQWLGVDSLQILLARQSSVADVLPKHSEKLGGTKKRSVLWYVREAAAAALESPPQVSTAGLILGAGDGALCTEAVVFLDAKRRIWQTRMYSSNVVGLVFFSTLFCALVGLLLAP